MAAGCAAVLPLVSVGAAESRSEWVCGPNGKSGS